MSGPWATACDGVTDLADLPRLPTAAMYITFALRPGPLLPGEGGTVRAGAYLRAYRRSLPDQGKRLADHVVGDERTTDDELLWQALAAVAAINCYPRQEWFAAAKVRRAETLLRVWWKRQQP
jgi:hypothetical protein